MKAESTLTTILKHLYMAQFPTSDDELFASNEEETKDISEILISALKALFEGQLAKSAGEEMGVSDTFREVVAAAGPIVKELRISDFKKLTKVEKYDNILTALNGVLKSENRVTLHTSINLESIGQTIGK